MAAPPSPQTSFSNGRRWLHWLNTLLGAIALLALVAMANYLAGGYSKRFQMDRLSPLKLSEQTRHVLDSLTNDVTITLFFEPHGDNEEIYTLSADLLTEYEQACPRHIHVKTLDYGREVGAAKEFLTRHNLAGLKEKDFVLFESGGAPKTVDAKDLANYDFSDLLSGRSKFVRRSEFLGELYFTENIYDVSNPRPAKAYFLTGHRENDPEDNKNPSGYSTVAAILTNELNCNWAKLSLQGTNGVPADCQLLIVAASAREEKMMPEELDKITAYLKQGGRMLALLTAESGLEKVLAGWGIEMAVTRDRVTDMNKNFNPGQTNSFLAACLPTHTIMNPLAADKGFLLMVLPRPLGESQGLSKLPGAPTVTTLAETSSEGVDETGQTGIYRLIEAIEQGGIQGAGGGTRIVVAGDSDFLDDQVIGYVSNRDFAKRAMSWLLQRPEIALPGLGPRPIRDYKLYMTRAQAEALRWLFLAGLPGSVLFVGGLVWLRRRS
jgi:ABC-2 type transport system permease protein